MVWPGRQSFASSARVGDVVVAQPKITVAAGGKVEHEHKDRLARMGCAVCRILFPGLSPGPVELHHLRTGGWGKGDFMTLMPLCFEHHRGNTGVHGLGTKGFTTHYGFDQQYLLDLTLKLVSAQYGSTSAAINKKATS